MKNNPTLNELSDVLKKDVDLLLIAGEHSGDELAADLISELKINNPNLDIKIMMMAPSKLFELENYDDPLMFVSLGNNYYYLIHKWGNDMSYFRKLLMWPFKNLYNIMVFICFLSLFLTAVIPDGLFFYKEITNYLYDIEYKGKLYFEIDPLITDQLIKFLLEKN